MELRDEYKNETGLDSHNDGIATNDYVLWLEQRIEIQEELLGKSDKATQSLLSRFLDVVSKHGKESQEAKDFLAKEDEDFRAMAAILLNAKDAHAEQHKHKWN